MTTAEALAVVREALDKDYVATYPEALAALALIEERQRELEAALRKIASALSRNDNEDEKLIASRALGGGE